MVLPPDELVNRDPARQVTYAGNERHQASSTETTTDRATITTALMSIATEISVIRSYGPVGTPR